MPAVHVTSANGQGQGVVPAHALKGELVGGTQVVNSPYGNPNIQPAGGSAAGLFSTAPYDDGSAERKRAILAQRAEAEAAEAAAKKAREGKCWAKDGTCNGWAQEKYGLCGGHTRYYEKHGEVH